MSRRVLYFESEIVTIKYVLLVNSRSSCTLVLILTCWKSTLSRLRLISGKIAVSRALITVTAPSALNVKHYRRLCRGRNKFNNLNKGVSIRPSKFLELDEERCEAYLFNAPHLFMANIKLFYAGEDQSINIWCRCKKMGILGEGNFSFWKWYLMIFFYAATYLYFNESYRTILLFIGVNGDSIRSFAKVL